MSVVVFPQSLRAFEIKSVWAVHAALLLDAHQASASSPAAWGRSVLSHHIISSQVMEKTFHRGAAEIGGWGDG